MFALMIYVRVQIGDIRDVDGARCSDSGIVSVVNLEVVDDFVADCLTPVVAMWVQIEVSSFETVCTIFPADVLWIGVDTVMAQFLVIGVR